MVGLVVAAASPCGAAFGQVTVDEPVRTDAQRDVFDVVVGIAQIVTAIGVPLLVLQISSARRDARSERTRAFQERYVSREFRTAASLTTAYLEVAGPADCVAKVQAWHSRQHAEDRCLPRTPARGPGAPKPAVNDVQQIMGFFEDFATAYNRGDLSRAVVRASFATPPVQLFVAGWWFICWRRRGELLGEEGQEVFGQFERMAKSIREKEKPLKAEFVPKASIRAICLPRGGDGATARDWERSKRLTTLLSRDSKSCVWALACLRAAEPAAVAQEQARGGERWWIVHVPPRIEAKPDAKWRAEKEQAGRLAWWLSRSDEQANLDDTIQYLERLLAN
jgi:hypothetical protein